MHFLELGSIQLTHGYTSAEIIMKTFDRITTDPNILEGQPCIRGQRLTVRRVLSALATYPDRDEFRREYPELEDEDIAQALEYAAASLADQVLELN